MGKRRRARLTIAARIRGGLRGFLAALDAAMDPDLPEPDGHHFRLSLSAADRRERDRRNRRSDKAADRLPF